jgi:hypothetical protein
MGGILVGCSNQSITRFDRQFIKRNRDSSPASALTPYRTKHSSYNGPHVWIWLLARNLALMKFNR